MKTPGHTLPEQEGRRDSEEDSQDNRRKRTKVRQACEPCKSRKRKCNGNLPCSECHRVGYICRYENKSASTEPIKFRPKASKQSFLANRSRTSDGVLDESRSRYVGSDSTIAFTGALNRDVNNEPLRVHAYGWHVGIREEPKTNLAIVHSPSLKAIVTSLVQLQALLAVYYAVINGIFALTEEASLSRSAEDLYSEDAGISALANQPEIEVVLVVAAALGSFFSGPNMDVTLEAALIERAEAILGSPATKRLPRKGHARALGLLTLYYRATTRPHVCWFTSCQSVLLCEAVGLHQNTPSSPTRDHDLVTFWMLKSMNSLISFEYGRSRIKLRNITCPPLSTSARLDTLAGRRLQSPAEFFVNIVGMLPGNQDDEEEEQDTWDAFSQFSEHLTSSHSVMPMVVADVLFCLYRRKRHRGLMLTQTEQEHILKIGGMTLEAAQELIRRKQPWWNLTNTVLQLICVLIAMDSAQGGDLLGPALNLLESVQQTFNTSMTRETLNIARKLVKAFLNRKRQNVDRWSQMTGEQEGRLEALSHRNLSISSLSSASTPFNSLQLESLLSDDLIAPWSELLSTEFGIVT